MSATRRIISQLVGRRPEEPYAVTQIDLPFGSGPLEAKVDWHNRRLKLIGLAAADLDRRDLDLLREALDASLCDKGIVYAYPGAEDLLAAGGLRHEADLAGYFVADIDAQIWSLFTDDARAQPAEPERMRTIVAAAEARGARPPVLAEGYRTRIATVDDVPRIGALLRATFPDYPTPIDDGFLHRVIDAGSSSFLLAEAADGALAATISAELNLLHGNAEISDCATVPAHRGRGLMRHLAAGIGAVVRERHDILHTFTLCRALETGINFAFADAGYRFTGHLVNNCRMPDGWETMNAWVR